MIFILKNLKTKKYIFIVIICALPMFIMSYYLTVAHIYEKSIVLYSQLFGIGFTLVTLVLNLAIAIFFGIYIALLFYKKEVVKNKSISDKITGIGGTAAAILASGCPACGLPLFAFLGFGAFISYLPYKGIEIKIISLILLLISIYLITKNIEKNLACKIPN